ncbi:hypothetical protein EGY22_12910 [Alcaligenes faecalis]|nr:hypothetical protein CPY64_07140 [Alcaligenes faecalis]AYZ92304.1 hypothetical protein EGY22_12910 [Alcaligenes faecalis]
MERLSTMSNDHEPSADNDIVKDVAVANFAVITAIIDALASSGSIDGNFLADRIKSYSDKMRSEESKTTMNFMSYYEALARNKASDAGSDND